MAQKQVSHGKYYSEDSEQRKGYFDQQFLSLAQTIAQGQGLSLSAFFANLKSFTSFKNYLEAVFSTDSSLAEYYNGMDNEEKREFFNRSVIQDIVDANKEEEEELIDEIQAPIFVQQVQKETRKYFDAVTKEGKKTRGYESTFKLRGKEVTRLRDARGRFVKKT